MVKVLRGYVTYSADVVVEVRHGVGGEQAGRESLLVGPEVRSLVSESSMLDYSIYNMTQTTACTGPKSGMIAHRYQFSSSYIRQSSAANSGPM